MGYYSLLLWTEDKMYHVFWRHALFVRGQSFSVKIFDRLRSGCHLIRLETIFVGLPGRRSLSPRVSPSCAPVLSCAHYIQAPATQADGPYLNSTLVPEQVFSKSAI